MFAIFKKISLYKKTAVFIIVVFAFFFALSFGKIYEKSEVEYGVTFSKKQAIDLGLDWQETYLAMFDDLGVEKIRLAAYWDEVEPREGEFFWQDLDWQLSEAQKRGAEVILGVGVRLPRWPECHSPDWAESLSKQEREDEILEYIKKTVNRYKGNTAIKLWQVENEPFLKHFGECPEPDADFLDTEISLVRSLDKRQIVVTDSGELSVWVPAAKRADIFGTTMYRKTYSDLLNSYVSYPIEPSFFRVKKNLADIFAEPEKWIVIELQAEPWGPVPFQELSAEERSKTMDLDKFREMIEFSRQAGFQEFYLWGVEWWYWEAKTQGNPGLWREARSLFVNKN